MSFTREDCQNLVEAMFEQAANSRTREELKHNHEQFVLKALGMFQLLEFALKKYLLAYYKVEDNNFIEEDKFDDLPLGILKKRIKSVIGDHELAEKIDKLMPIRNDIAHQSLFELLGNNPFEKQKYFSKGLESLPILWNIEEVLFEVKDKVQNLYQRKVT